MKTERAEYWAVSSNSSPTVEIDTEAAAAYVRFKKSRIVRTVRHSSKWPIVTIDLDAQGEVVGLEFVGVRRFDLRHLLRHLPLKVAARVLARASYVAAERELTTA